MILVNGFAATHVPVQDRGLQYGDGVFETIAVCNGEPLLWSRHLARLQLGCSRLRLPAPDGQQLYDEAAKLCRDSTRAVLKLIITRGSAGRGYRSPVEGTATRIMMRLPFPDYPPHGYRDGIRTRICQLRLGHNPLLAGIKHLNRLEQVLARQEWDDDDITEGLLRDSDGLVIEGTMSNLFIVRNRQLLTPELTQCGVAGVMREVIIEQAAALGLGCRITTLTVEDLRQADELMCCNSLGGLWPVRQVDEQNYPVGALTRQLQQALGKQTPPCVC
ncbi:MAG: aminodeoxychorismate lyase [Gammaproteobacteria bacterium]|nr:aminodeoxychorismate lyase [Gammaproteobacteria bacterium]